MNDVIHGMDLVSQGRIIEARERDSNGTRSAPAAELQIAICSTFTADLLRAPLEFWMHALDIEGRVDLAPYAQVIQELLNPTSLLAGNKSGFNLLVIRLEDWLRDRRDDEAADDHLKYLRDAATDFCEAAKRFRERTSASMCVFICPSSRAARDKYGDALEMLIEGVQSAILRSPDLHLLTHRDVITLYPLVDYEDARMDRLAHVPYTEEYFAAIATVFARRIAAAVKPKCKVLAVDCDNTLWAGICGEDGPAGIEVTAEHRAFQQLLVRQYEAGVLLCLCSKNNEKDVEAVLRNHPDMVLREQHVVACCVNWNSKAQNLKRLSQQLNLSLDSFVFIDDSPVECAEVRTECPSVLTLQFPKTGAEILRFITHVWAFDQVAATSDARRRTQQYRENRRRELAAEAAGDFEGFLASLNLVVNVSRATAGDLARVAELVQRTNQFNMTAIRRHASEIAEFLKSRQREVLVVSVRDRFGDYGVVGALLVTRESASSLDVDTFVLSCRVLGRRVEHAIIRELGRTALTESRGTLVLRCRNTSRNAPARDFLIANFRQFRRSDSIDKTEEVVYEIPAEFAEGLIGKEAEKTANHDGERPDPVKRDECRRGFLSWHEKAYELSDIANVVRVMKGWRATMRTRDATLSPRTPVEKAVAEVWEDVLGVRGVGIDDDFVTLGGDSLRAAQAIARIATVTGKEMSLAQFFKSPTVDGICEVISRTKSDGSQATGDPLSRIAPRDTRSEELPLSYAQERLWFLDQVGLVGAAYNVPLALRLIGRLSVETLEKSFFELVRRHEVLRTRFAVREGVPYQRIDAQGTFQLRCADLSHVKDADEREARLKDWMRKEQLHAFDLEKEQPLRANLIILHPEEHVLAVTIHHIAFDGWSRAILIRELSTLYSGYLSGEGCPLTEMPLQYADYAIWQRRWSNEQVISPQLRYWREQLFGAPPQLSLPTDKPRPAIESFEGAECRFELPLDLLKSLKALAKENGATLFMVCLAAYQALLSRWSGQDEVLVGSPIAGRRNQQLESLIGFFVNTLVFRTVVDFRRTFQELLQHVRDTTLKAYANQDVPFDLLVKELRPERTLTRQPVFQVWLALQNFPEGRLELPGIRWQWAGVDWSSTHFDLGLYLYEGPKGLTAVFEYSTDLFERPTIERIANSFSVLLRSIVVDPNRLVGRLPMLDDATRNGLLTKCNLTAQYKRGDRCVHELFSMQASRTPDSVAITSEGLWLTYAELDARANGLSRLLVRKGVGPEQRVAFCLERNAASAIAMIAILKTGGAYVPLDPSYPSERLQYMVEDCKPKVVLVQRSLRSRVSNIQAPLETFDEIGGEIGESLPADVLAPAANVNPEALAYVIYTSGSTGSPKGVMVEHRQVVRLFKTTERLFGFGQHDVWTVFHSFAFDFSVWEFWGALLYGGRAVIVPYLTAREPTQFYRLLCREAVTVLNQTPSAFRVLIGAQERSGGSHALRFVVFGGEALEISSLRPWVDANGDEQPRLINMYGITETTVHVTYRTVTRDAVESEWGSVIGVPIDDLTVYLLDEWRELVPVGVVGEMYVGGAGAARGYLNRPQLTGERFVADPYGVQPGARLYRTGDLGRRRADGTLEYLGRNDNQVKIRGYRIELGEIERQIATHPRVQDVAVIARQDEQSDKRLVAYVVGKRSIDGDGDSALTSTTLSSEVVSGWESVFEQTYENGQSAPGPTFVGWSSSYTGEPIPEREMQEWLDNTIALISGFCGRRVLEIGCGVGLVLQHVAPSSALYTGTDFSMSAIQRLRAWVRGRPDLTRVQLLHRPATDFSGMQNGAYDTVLVNSVVQYFPDIEYLVSVIQSAVRVVSEGGVIFLGDIRHLGTLPVFHSSVQLARAGANVSMMQLHRRVERSIALERELVIDPSFFQAICERVPGLASVAIHLKRGRARNELTQHRYDVVLRVGRRQASQELFQDLHWDNSPVYLSGLEERLRLTRPLRMRITSVPNARLALDLAAHGMIEGSDAAVHASTVRTKLREMKADGLDPQDLYELGESLGYDVHAYWSADGAAGQFDVEFRDVKGSEWHQESIDPPPSVRPWSAYATDPLEFSFRQQLIPELRAHVRLCLPEHMVPSAWVVMRQLPLTANGKLDRRALPKPESRPEELGEFVAPRTEMERVLARVWAEILKIDQVGVNDNFFELGGHSLLIVRVLDRLQQENITLELRSVYASPTLGELALHATLAEDIKLVVPPSGIPADCDAITPDMLPLIELRPEHIRTIVAAVPGGSENIQDIYPLAPLQEGILFHHLVNERGGDAYARFLLLSIASREKMEELVGALNQVVERHDILRTAVLWEGLPRPVQVVQRRVKLPVEVIRLESGRDAIEQLRSRMNARKAFVDLRTAPLLRVELAEKAVEGRWFALIHTHHLIFDAQSLHALLDELLLHVDCHASQLPEATAYRHYVAQCILRNKARDSESFFRKKLAGIQEPTAPFGILDVHGDGDDARQTRQALDSTLARRLRAEAKRAGVSAATLFHAAWALVVARTSGRDDVVFGTVLLGRMQISGLSQGALGMFINTLPIRVCLRGFPAKELVRHVQGELAELIEHEQASLAVAQRCSEVRGTAPLFCALLNYIHSRQTDDRKRRDSGSSVKLIDSRGWTNYPLTLSVYEHPEGFVLELETRGSIEAAMVMEYVVGATRALLDALEGDVVEQVSTLGILPRYEFDKVIRAFNDTRTGYPVGTPVHRLFEKSVTALPDSIALIDQGDYLTYAELNAAANRLAHYLRRRGVACGDSVPIVMARGQGLLIAQLAVLKSGANYIPLDPGTPAHRLLFILRASGATLVLADRVAPQQLSEQEMQWIVFNEISEVLEALPTEDLSVPLGGEAIAYVMYTSGSTGTPKGVMVPHRAVNRLVIENRYAAIDGTDCVAHCSNPAFDASTFEIWGAWLNGASVLIVPQAVLVDPELFADALARSQVTVLWLTIGLFVRYTDSLACVFRRLRYLMTGGDVVEPASLERVARNSPPWRLMNAYGPTECTTFSTTYTVDAETSFTKPIPIGKPIANAKIHILDRYLQPVPIGVTGEIYIGGAGLALGYFRAPELTAERFVADSFGESGGRLYRSGDLGRWSADGNVEFLGRNDHQIKLRGYRIELGEIEAAIARDERVKEVVVVACDDGAMGKKLNAYIAARERDAGLIAGLRQDLLKVLPDYMIPSGFTFLESMPLNVNGKIDRRRLPAPDWNTSAELRTEQQPLGEVEQALKGLWQRVLGVTRVERDDNFFSLGGHSLLVLELLFRMKETLGCSLHVKDVYGSPTLRELSGRVEGQVAADRAVDLRAESQLPTGFTAISGSAAALQQCVLLTGATGFVGRFLLAQLLNDTAVSVCCIVRAASHSHAFSRIRDSLEKWGLWREDYRSRVVAIPGDLRQPRLGVDEVSYRFIVETIDTIYHCGTSMNHLETYSAAKPANVGSVKELLTIAVTRRLKALNYLSTLNVFAVGQKAHSRVVNESTPIEMEQHFASQGYVSSKWVAEKIVLEAADLGLPCNVFRLGLVWADSERGRYDDAQRELMILKSCLQSGFGIQGYTYRLAPTPVDYVAKSVAFLGRKHREGRSIFHISAVDQKIDGLFECCNEILHGKLRLLPHYEWVCEMRRLHDRGRSMPIVPLIEFAFSLDEKCFYEHEAVSGSAGTVFDFNRTHSELEAAGIPAPVVDEMMLRKCVLTILAEDGELDAGRGSGSPDVVTNSDFGRGSARAAARA